MELPPLFAPGQRLGRFELVQRLAVGGMAEVYLAYAHGPGGFRKVVAIKRLLPQHALDPQLLRMFLDEARLMARLSHPNVTQVAEVDDGGGIEVPYFVMEYVHGTDLRGILNAAAGPLPIEHALAIASAVAAGLHHAHEQRGAGGQPLEIVHRDVSPSNVLISFDGGVKVTDFGVAKWTEQRSFTHQGQLKGKFAHMSPEQCRGEALDRRSDVFALGTLLYEMTTGHPPFVAESEYELLTQIVSREAAPPKWEDKEAGKEYPADLAAIVMRSLRRSRDDRTPSTQHLQLELEDFARKGKLVVSPVALAEYLESLFSARVMEWREALESGQTLADQLERRPANAQRSPAGPSANDRTETDAFAVAPTASSADNARLQPSFAAKSAAGSAATAAAAAPRAVRSTRVARATSLPRSNLVRVLAITAGAALAVVTLFTATELTSRWQRGSQSDVADVADTAGTAAVGRFEAIAPAPQIPGKALNNEKASAAPKREPATSSSSAGHQATPSAGTPARRGHDTVVAARQARRGGATTVVAPSDGERAISERRPEGSPEAPPSAAVPQGSPSPQPPTSDPPTTTERPAAPPPTPVKVWDPDSPVPP
jgi:serine/threonine protein kinase